MNDMISYMSLNFDDVTVQSILLDYTQCFLVIHSFNLTYVSKNQSLFISTACVVGEEGDKACKAVNPDKPKCKAGKAPADTRTKRATMGKCESKIFTHCLLLDRSLISLKE